MDYGVNSLPIPDFNGEDYKYQASKMKHFLIGKGIWDIIEDGYVELDWATLPQADRLAKREAQKKNSFAIYHLKLQYKKGCIEGIER